MYLYPVSTVYLIELIGDDDNDIPKGTIVYLFIVM